MTPCTRLGSGWRRALLIIAVFGGCLTGLSAKEKWDPVPKADLEAKECVKYPGVAAEELFRHQVLDANDDTAWNEYYLRRKVYNAKAAQDAGVLNIEYRAGTTLTSLAARVVKANGTIVELGPNDFSDSVAIKTFSVKIKSKSVAVPNLEAGDIVEYQWREPAEGDFYQPQTWFIQSVYPTRLYTFTLRNSKSDCQVLWFNIANAKPSMVKGKQVLTVTDMPAWETEPNTPPERDLRGSIVIINTGHWARWWGKEDLWKELSSDWGENFRLAVKPDLEIKKAAAAAVGDAKTDDEKLTRLYDYARTQITNFNYFDNAELQAIKKKREDSTNGENFPPDTLKAKAGYPDDVNQLFAAMCVAAGYEVRRVWGSSRTETTDVRNDQGFVFLNYPLIAVHVGDGWRFYRPGDYFVSPGLVDWQYETAPGLLCEEDAKAVVFAVPPPAPAGASEELRSGQFALTAEGDCEGTVKISYTGHLAVEKKHAWANRPQDELEKLVRDDLATRLPAAEVSDITFTNTGGTAEPTTVAYKLKVAGYAESAGERLIFAPDIFQKGVSPVFKNSTRKWPISFPYAYRTREEITLALPADYELDAPTSPPGFGAEADPFRARYKIALRKTSHSLVYSRDVSIADGGVLNIPAAAYPQIKKIFDLLQRSDSHTLVIKPKEVTEPAPAPAATTPAAPAKS